MLAPCASAQSFLHWPDAVGWQVGTGVDYSTGRYGGTSDTTVFSVPLDAKLQLDRVRLELTIPYLDVKGPGTLVGGVVIGGSGPVTTRNGIGDLNVGAAWLLSADGSLPAFEIEGIVKVPTAAAGLGTGKFDYSVQANVYHAITPRFMLFGSLGYQWLNSFSTYHLESGIAASAGMNFKTTDSTSIGLSANYRQEYYGGLGDETTLSPYVMWNLNKDWRVTGYGTLGFGKASPRYGLGMRLILYR